MKEAGAAPVSGGRQGVTGEGAEFTALEDGLM